jgi:flavin reductase (DIM6/NTAB) family NADH-FMN oxidoreductase RutF
MAADAIGQLRETLARIPGGLFLLTAAHDERRSGVLTSWVQRCSEHPPMVMIALPKGTPVESLIRDARVFALCQISDDDRFLIRKFAHPPDRDDDPFVTLQTTCTPSGAPVVTRAMSYLECELMMHVDLESDHRMFIALVNSARILHDRRPAVCFGHCNGAIGGAGSSASTNGTHDHEYE